MKDPLVVARMADGTTVRVIPAIHDSPQMYRVEFPDDIFDDLPVFDCQLLEWALDHAGDYEFWLNSWGDIESEDEEETP